jgi:adenosylcobinamide amidohydrolase
MPASAPASTPTARIERIAQWLVVNFDCPHRVASWAIAGGGIGTANVVAWRQVAERELRPPVDPARWLRARMREAGIEGAVGMLTSRDLDAWVEASSECARARAHCIATVGLGNALRAGDPPGPFARIGTINILCRVETPLTHQALLEGLAIATEAKVAAVLEAGVVSRRSGLPATGTGTDCVVVAAPLGRSPSPYAGKHTEIGAVIGRAVRDAVDAGVRGCRAPREDR